MAEQTNADLIAEANRAATCIEPDSASLVSRLVDALEAAEKRAEILSEAVRQVRGLLEAAEKRAGQFEASRNNALREEALLRAANQELFARAVAAEKRAEDAPCHHQNAAYLRMMAERDQLAAVVEKVREWAHCPDDADEAAFDELHNILDSPPAAALREHDATLIEGLADEVHATLSDPNRKRPRDPQGEFATDLLNDVAWVVYLIREKARQRREEKS